MSTHEEVLQEVSTILPLIQAYLQAVKYLLDAVPYSERKTELEALKQLYRVRGLNVDKLVMSADALGIRLPK